MSRKVRGRAVGQLEVGQMDRAPMVLRVEGFSFEVDESGEPRIRDVDLAERLGYERPRTIRELVERMVDSGEIVDVSPRRTVRPGKFRGKTQELVEVIEYWLDEEQALLVCMRSDAPRAADVRRVIVKVFRAAIRQMDVEIRRTTGVWKRLIEALLLPKPAEEWDRMFQPSLVRSLVALHGEQYAGGPHPRYLSSTNRKIYDIIFSTPVGAEIKRRNPEPKHGQNHHQQLTPEAREYFASQLLIVEAIANQSENKADFWARMERHFGNGMLQLALPEAS